MAIEKILIVDDEILMRDFLAETLRRKNMEVFTAENGRKAIELLGEQVFDLVITDMRMPDLNGIDVLRRVKEISPSTIVVIMTAFGSIENAIEAMRLGAFNYLLKPFSPDSIEAIIEKAGEHLSLIEENDYLRHQVNTGNSRSVQRVIGESSAMKKILQDVLQIAKSNAPVFISGESGTGKEVIAQAIHTHSPRAKRPFIRVNCAAIPETLIESEFFGHEKGAFTGANSKRLGRFELANGGTLLLDEISEIPLSVQAKLLRVTQEQEFERVGGTKSVKVDVRLISTSNRDIKEMIEKKILREDLYYRLNVVPIYIPPLRERREDILPLSEYFIERICQENHKEIKLLAANAKQKLLNYPWPGNVRELANILERVVVMHTAKEIKAEELLIDQDAPLPTRLPEAAAPVSQTLTLRDLEKKFIIESLTSHNQNRTKTAQALGISLRTLRNKLKEYNLKDEE